MPGVTVAACQEWQHSMSNHAYLLSLVMKSQKYRESHYLALSRIKQLLFHNLGDKEC